MTASIHKFAPNAHSVSSVAGERACAAAHGDEDRSAASRSAHPLPADVAVVAGHVRRSCRQAAGGDAACERRLLARQGMALLLAGLQLLDEAKP